jgi:hypothetical protein
MHGKRIVKGHGDDGLHRSFIEKFADFDICDLHILTRPFSSVLLDVDIITPICDGYAKNRKRKFEFFFAIKNFSWLLCE